MEAVCPFCRTFALIEETSDGLRCTSCLNTGTPQWAPQAAPAEEAGSPEEEAHEEAWAETVEPVPVYSAGWPGAPMRGKSPLGAAVRSLILPGWGQGYARGASAGWTWFGLTTLVLTAALVLDSLGAPGAFFFIIWTVAQVSTAYSFARAHNEHFGLTPGRDGVLISVLALAGLAVLLVLSSVVFVLASDLPDDGAVRGDGTDAASRLGPTQPQDLLQPCNASVARTWLQDLEALSSYSFTIRGTEHGEPVDVQVDHDAAADYLFVALGTTGEQLHAVGSRVYLTDATGTTEYRDFGDPPYAHRFMEDDTDADPASDWFTTPLVALSPTCELRAGTPSYVLSFDGTGVSEEWIWSEDGQLVAATFQRAATSTDLELTHDTSWRQRPAPTTTDRGASVTYSVIAADATGTTLRIEEDFHVPYSDITIDLYRGEELLAELSEEDGWSSTAGSVRLRDQGQRGMLDTGDTITIRHASDIQFHFYDTWSGTYFEEYALEEESQVLPDPLAGTEMVHRHYAWSFQGEDYTLDLQVPLSLLELYESTGFTYRDGKHNYAAYVASQYDDETIQAIADELVRLGEQEGMSEHARVSNVLSFVQSLEYTSDSVTTGYDEYPRYPIQTLVEHGGDCEDTAILFAAIVQAMGYGVVLLELPGHMATGVLVEDGFEGTSYVHQDKRWAYAETTGDGFRLGQLPDEYTTSKATIHALTAQAVVVIDDVVTTRDAGATKVTVDFSNDGLRGTGRGTAAVYGMDSSGARYHDSDSCTFEVLEPGATYTCDLFIRDDARIRSYLVQVRTQDGFLAEHAV